MRKKWTYVAIFSMMLGMAPVFTGCIDTDEPAGLEQLRGAKAELLKARIKVEEANAANILADAALKEAQQQIVAAEARYKEALAAEQEYKALEQQYLAELQNIKNQEEQAYYENLLNELRAAQEQREREKQLADAQLAVSLEQLKAELLRQQALYDEALKNLALAQNTLTEAQKTHLEAWTTAVKNAKDAVEQATIEYERQYGNFEEAVKALEEAEADELAIRGLNREIYYKQNAFNAADAAYKTAVAAQEADYSTIEAMNAHKAEYEAQLENIEKVLADLDVERTKLETETASEAANVDKLYKAYTAIVGVWDNQGNLTAAGTKEYTLPEIKFQNRNIPGLNDHIGYVNNMGVDEFKYKYSDYLYALSQGTADAFGQKATLNRYINDVNSWTRTANDNAWTNNDILQYQADLETINEEIETVKADWKKAVDAYVGKLEVDATQLPGYEDVKAGVDAYNTAVSAFITARTNYETYVKENLPSYDVLDQAIRAAEEVRAVAIDANAIEYGNAIQGAYQAMQQARAAYESAQAVLRKAEAEYALLTNPTAEDANKVNEARTAVQNRWNLYLEAEDEYNQAEPDAREIQRKKDELAQANYEVAEKAAWETYWKTYTGDQAIQDRTQELSKLVNEANDAMYEAYNDAQDTYSEYASEYGFWSWSSVLNEALNYTDPETYVWIPQQADAIKVAEVYRDQLLTYIVNKSVRLFGVSDRLVDFTVEEMKAEIEKRFMDSNPDADFVPYTMVNSELHWNYGLVGDAAYCQAQIDIAKAVLDNEEAVAALKKELTDALASVNAAIAKVGEEADAAKKAYTDADAALKAKFADIDKRENEATATKYATKPVLDAIVSAIKVYVNAENKDADTLEELKNALAKAVTEAEKKRYNAETDLLVAQKALEDYTGDIKDWIEIAKENSDNAYADLQEAQEALAAANEALLAEIDRISQQTDEVTE